MLEQTQFLALMIGGYMLASGIGLLLSTDHYAKMVAESANTNPIALNLVGAVTFAVGLAVVLSHFRWGGLVEALVSLFGVMALVKGVLLITLPALVLARAPRIGRGGLRFAGGAFVVYGGYLLYAGLMVARGSGA